MTAGREPGRSGSHGSQTVTYDDILKQIGQFGRWQIQIFFLLWLTSAAAGLAVVVFAYTGFVPRYRCAVPHCETTATNYTDFKTDNFTSIAYTGIPDLTSKTSCEYYTVKDLDSVSSCDAYLDRVQQNASGEVTVAQCSQDDLIFDKRVVHSSIVSLFGFTCDRAIMRDVYNAIYMFGMLIGSFFIGLISDRFGRMRALMLSVMLVSISGILGAFFCREAGYGFVRFFTGIGGIGCFMVTFVLAVEYVGFKYTMLVGILIEVPFALGEMVLGLEAYLIRDWEALQIVAYAPLIILLFLWFFVPESPRWLLASGRVQEARKIIEEGARINKRPLSPGIFEDMPMESKGVAVVNGGEKNGGVESNEEVETMKEPNPTIIDLFQPNEILFRSLNMMYQWFSVTMCYYGLSFASTDLSEGGTYINFMLSVFVEIPGYLFCIFVMDCWGRRPILSFCQFISGACCLAAGLMSGIDGLENDENYGLLVFQIFLSLIGKFGASACFAIVYVYTAELFPTIIRNTAIGSCSTIARVGGIVSLIMSYLQNVWKPFPMVIMGVIAMVAGFLAIFFPETVGQKLPETMDDAIQIGRNNSRGMCTCIMPDYLQKQIDKRKN